MTLDWHFDGVREVDVHLRGLLGHQLAIWKGFGRYLLSEAVQGRNTSSARQQRGTAFSLSECLLRMGRHRQILSERVEASLPLVQNRVVAALELEGIHCTFGVDWRGRRFVVNCMQPTR